MKWLASGCCAMLALMLAVAGCGGGAATTVPLTVTITPTAVTALVGGLVQFAITPSASVDTVAFLVNGVTGGNASVGTITTDGLYQAPPVVPANTAITVTVNVADSTTGASATATATVTLDSGVRVGISPATYTIGFNETFSFRPKTFESGVPPGAVIPGVCDNSGSPLCTDFTWGSTAAGGSIDGNGNYTAPPSGATDTITATSIYDPTQKATATVTLVTPTDPTLTSISNTVGAVGAAQQDVYLTGSGFISTTQVFFNGNLVSDTDAVSSAVIRARLADTDLKAPGTFEFTALRQGSTAVGCSSPCTVTLSARRPAIVSTTPDTFSQGSSPTLGVDGGYYGPSAAPTVSAQFGSQPASGTVLNANQLSLAAGGSDANTPGLVPVTVTSNVAGAVVPPAVANVAVQPVYSSPPSAVSAPLNVGTQPSAVAINTATRIAVVANQGSNSVTLIDLNGPTVLGFICTSDTVSGATLLANDLSCPASGPTSVAVDNLRNLALVTNGNIAVANVAVIDLAAQRVREIIPSGVTSIARTPWAVAINPLSGRAVVAYQTAGFASIIDLNQVPAAVIGLVADGTGPTPRVAVSPRLNWGLITPGGGGGLTIVDLGRQSVNSISSAARSGNVVTITTSSPHTLRVGDPVLIMGVADSTFNGVFNVTSTLGNTFTYSQNASNANSGGGTANYALPVATVATSLSVIGVGINDETQKAILVDPTGPQGNIFNLLDQTSKAVSGLALVGNTAAAFDPLTNVAVTVNRINSDGAIIDPINSTVLANGTLSGLNQPVDVAIDPGANQTVIVNSPLASPPITGTVSIFSLGSIRTPQILQVSRQDTATPASPISPQPQPPEITVNSTLTTAATANPQTLTIIGSGFINGTSVARLDGTNLATTFVNSRELTALVPAAMLTAGPRLYALEVANGGGTPSNAATFTVTQSIDVGCSPLGVAIDSALNKAVVTNPSCSSVAVIDLAAGTGQTVLVGTTPQGVAVHLGTGLAVVANQGSNNASLVDIAGGTVVATVATDPAPTGVAVDEGLGVAVVTASNANVVDAFTIGTTPGTPTAIGVQQRPVAVAVDPVRHVAAVANTNSSTVSLVDLTTNTATDLIAANGLPAGIAFDPVSSDFLVAASLLNQVLVLDPVSRSTTALRVGINPTSIAYNFNTGTVVTTNGSSQTMSVMDFFTGAVRAVLSFRPSGRFAVDINPFTNIAVITDSADNKVILRPLPR